MASFFSKMLRLGAYKTQLDLNNVLRTQLLRHAGAKRWAFNWGLRRKIEEYEKTGKSPSAPALHRELNRLKKAPPGRGWSPLDVRGLQMRSSGGAPRPRPGLSELLQTPEDRGEAGLPQVQVQEEGDREFPADRDDPGLRTPYPAPAPGAPTAQGARLPAFRQPQGPHPLRHGQGASGPLVCVAPGGGGGPTPRAHPGDGRRRCGDQRSGH